MNVVNIYYKIIRKIRDFIRVITYFFLLSHKVFWHLVTKAVSSNLILLLSDHVG